MLKISIICEQHYKNNFFAEFLGKMCKLNFSFPRILLQCELLVFKFNCKQLKIVSVITLNYKIVKMQVQLGRISNLYTFIIKMQKIKRYSLSSNQKITQIKLTSFGSAMKKSILFLNHF